MEDFSDAAEVGWSLTHGEQSTFEKHLQASQPHALQGLAQRAPCLWAMFAQFGKTSASDSPSSLWVS